MAQPIRKVRKEILLNPSNSPVRDEYDTHDASEIEAAALLAQSDSPEYMARKAAYPMQEAERARAMQQGVAPIGAQPSNWQAPKPQPTHLRDPNDTRRRNPAKEDPMAVALLEAKNQAEKARANNPQMGDPLPPVVPPVQQEYGGYAPPAEETGLSAQEQYHNFLRNVKQKKTKSTTTKYYDEFSKIAKKASGYRKSLQEYLEVFHRPLCTMFDEFIRVFDNYDFDLDAVEDENKFGVSNEDSSFMVSYDPYAMKISVEAPFELDFLTLVSKDDPSTLLLKYEDYPDNDKGILEQIYICLKDFVVKYIEFLKKEEEKLASQRVD